MISKNPKSRKSGQAKRLETLKVETKKQKLEFLEHLAKSSIVQLACERSSVGRSTYYDWRQKDKKFAEEADEVKKAGELVINDLAESHLIHNIQDGQNTAIIFWLKNHHNGYGDKIRHEHELVPVDFTPDEQIAIAKAMFNAGQFTKFARDSMIRSAGGIPPNIPGEEEMMNETLRQAEEIRVRNLDEDKKRKEKMKNFSNNPSQITENFEKPINDPVVVPPKSKIERKGVNIAEFAKKLKEKRRLEGK
jgi:hypothetical protein